MSLRDITEDLTTRGYVKSGKYSKKTRQYLSDGEFNNIVLSIKKFEDWISKSRAKDKIMYYRGFLFAPDIQKLSPTEDRVRVWKLRNHVHGSYINKLVTLVQKKHDDLDYEYWAIRK